MSTVRPTKKQQELLRYIRDFIAKNGYSPSYREIMNGLQYTSVATVALHIRSLIARGHLRKRDHSARSLEVVADSSQAAESGDVVGSQSWLDGKVQAWWQAPTTTVEQQQLVAQAFKLLAIELPIRQLADIDES